MIYRKFNPCDILKPFVECYFIWESDGELIRDMIVESPPNGFCSMVFNNGDEYLLTNKKYEKLKVPKQFVSGQSIYSYKLFLNGNISLAGIVFKPAALATLLGLPTYAYTEERIPLQQIFNKQLLDEVTNKIQNANTSKDKVKILEEFVLMFYYKNKPEPDYIDYAANSIIEKNGMIHVSDLLKEVFMSRRNFERKFFRKVGLSPKYYARIRRIGYLMNEIAGIKKSKLEFFIC